MVAFLDRNRLQFFAVEKGDVASLELPPTLVKDLVVVDRPGLEKLVGGFLAGQKITPGPLAMVLAEAVCFFTVVKPADEQHKELVAQQFFDAIPFGTLLKRIYPQDKEYLLAATSREFMETLNSILLHAGFSLWCILPAPILGQLGAKRWLDAELGRYVSRNINSLRGLSLTGEANFGRLPAKETPVGPRPKSQNVLVAVFISLLAVLALLVIARFVLRII